MASVADDQHKRAAAILRETLATYEKQRDLILLGAYDYGTDEATDYVIDRIEEIEAFLRQSTEENQALETTASELVKLFSDRL